jgi:hypothetical protein
MALDFKDDSAANPTAPFGTVRHYGYDSTGLAVV